MLQKDSFQRVRPLFAVGGGGEPLSLLVAFALLCATLVFTGCEQDADSGGVLIGTWQFSYEYNGTITVDEYIITLGTIKHAGSYEGQIVNSPDFEASYGVLIIEFTKYADNWGDEPSADSDSVGKFGAMYWKDLTSNSVYMADAYDNGYPMFDTLDEAKKAFTNENVSTYVSNWSIASPYTR